MSQPEATLYGFQNSRRIFLIGTPETGKTGATRGKTAGRMQRRRHLLKITNILNQDIRSRRQANRRSAQDHPEQQKAANLRTPTHPSLQSNTPHTGRVPHG